jgi:simple sugar transport system ATP-binding protein
MRDGLVATFPVQDNLVLNSYHDAPYARRGWTNRAAVAVRAQTLVREYDVRTPSTLVPVAALSGGNQQKVVVARELSHEGSTLLIAAQPTRGVDVGSIEYIHSRIVAKRDAGMAVLLVSTELDEILSLADRIAVIYRGRIVGSLTRDAATREEIGLLMAGLSQTHGGTVKEASDD